LNHEVSPSRYAMPRATSKYVCQICGYESPRWMGRCPGCGDWNCLVEETVAPSRDRSESSRPSRAAPASPLAEVTSSASRRISTGIGELDAVLGGGIVPGSTVLVGGDPGIGKSTLLLQVAGRLSRADSPVLYVTGEESPEQIKMRADRLGVDPDGLYVMPSTDIEAARETGAEMSAGFIVIDSIQTMRQDALNSAAGSISQVRGCAETMIDYAKSRDTPVFLIGHVTKEGAIAGPRALEHMVDTVLYFEGDRHHVYRILRAVKNRFGGTDEIAVFQMAEEGLVEVKNPSESLLAERASNAPGSAVTATMEGRRPILCEIQALVAPTYFPVPKRTTIGYDGNRTQMILAVLERRAGIPIGNRDVYLNVVGGMRIVEPAADLAVAAAVVSSLWDGAIDAGTIVMGEVGLSGELRPVAQTDRRLAEAQKLGFETAVIPSSSRVREGAKGIRVTRLGCLREAMRALIPRKRAANETRES
jgi:DNA repair protein RadA/Sms